MLIFLGLRLYPPATFVISRTAAQDVEFEGITIPKGTRIGIGSSCLHRREDVWENPEKFDPERFSEENAHGRNPWSYAPFSLGSRSW
jgi:cytochrome P450 family 4 subfamily B polypeptide 1